MGKITTAVFEPGSTTANAYGLWQYDYGQALRIQGLNLPSAVEIHFSLQESGGTSVSRVGVTKDGVTDVIIPDSMLENDGADKTYDMFAFVYLTDAASGQTEYKIKLQVKSRPKPEAPGGGENPNIFHEAVQAVQKSADKAAESEKQAEGWAHGREDLPERAQDNAKYYSDQTAADAKKTEVDRKEVERLVESVSDIDQQVTKVENLTKQAQTSATNAALSEQAAKTSETNAQTAQAGAETAEGNAELAERNAKASEQAVETAKQLVTQMGQEVLNNKNHVDQTVQAFDLTAQQAVADVNNAGQTQIERVQSAGNTAVEFVKTAQNSAAEAFKAVQTEGTTQTENVTQEGEKQVQAVRAAAQEIVADREQIVQNKAGIEAIKQGKADAIVETASGETIQAEDSSGLGFEGLRIFGKSTQDGAPSPESPVPIASVGDKGTIEVEVTGKNLFDETLLLKNGGEKQPDGSIYISQKEIVVFENITQKDIGQLCISYDIKTFENKNSFVFYIKYTDKAEEYIGRKANNTFQKQQGTTNRNKTISSIKILYGEFGNHYVKDIQIEKGSVATDYEPYRTPQSLTLATPNGLPGIKVDKDGNYTDSNGQQWICDERDYESKVRIKRIEKFRVNYEKVSYDPNIGYASVSNTLNADIKYLNAAICTHLKTEIAKCFWIDSTGRNSRFKIDTFSTESEYKEFFRGNNVEVMYILAEPITTPLTPEEIAAYKALHTNYPTTVISNDESAHMEVSYVADTKNYIASKIETPLQKQITDLQNALISQKISGGV